LGNPAGGRWAACPRTGGSLGACRTLPEALGAASMADGRFAGDGTGAGCAGGSGSSRVENSPILARNSVIRGFETRFSAAKSGDPGIKNGQWSPFSGRVRRSRESDTFARLPSERSDFQALRWTITARLTASARLEKATGSAILRGDAAKKGQGIMAVVGYARVSTEDQSTEGADPGSSEVRLH
jgi:hypothetical protein